MKESGGHAVKLEGGSEIVETINVSDFCSENRINEIDIIKIVQASCLIIFVIEISMRFIARDSIKSFFKDGWNIFDLVIVIISLIPENISAESGLVSSFRVLRIFRVLRLLRASPEIRLIVSVLIKSIKSLWYNAMVYVIF